MYYLICTLVITGSLYIFLEAYKKARYFSKWGIPQPYEVPFLGVVHALFWPRRNVNNFIKYIYDSNKDAKYVGFHLFTAPSLLIKDLDLIKSILVKNFESFADHKTFVNEEADPLFGRNIAFINGDRWREARNALSPSFTASKLRSMYVLMSNCAQNFSDQFVKLYENADAIDIADVSSRYMNDVMASCVFGIELDSLKDRNNEFYLQATGSATIKGKMLLKILLEMMLPNLSRKLGLRFVSKSATDFFVSVVDETIKLRQKNGEVRPDVLQQMMEARNKLTEASASKLDLLEMTAHLFVFFLAGLEAASNHLCFVAHELAVNPDVQEKLQAEVDYIMQISSGKPSYEVINNNTPLLDAVINETLRKHPIGFLNRICTKEFELPAALPGSKPYLVKPGMGIIIPVAGIHSDPSLYDDPDSFDPDRFINKKPTISDISNLGLGMGPRVCIGARFAVLETKALFINLLSKCTLLPCDKTCIPLEYCNNSFAPVAKGGFWLKMKPRNL